LPRKMRARTGAARVISPPASVLTNKKTVVPRAPKANTEASYLKVSTEMCSRASGDDSSSAISRVNPSTR